MASIKVKLFTQASQFTGLKTLLGTTPANFRWFDVQLPQSQATFPAVVVNQIGAPPMYVANGRLSTYFARMQLTVYGTGNDSENATTVVQALKDFFKVFNATAVASAPAFPNRILQDKDGGIAATQPLTYQRFIDVMVFNDENV
jgi:hypothetical protein